MDKTCSIVQDLLPLYEEDMLREETKEFVDGHLSQCAACRAELDALKADAGVIDRPIGHAEGVRRCVDPAGRRAVTHYAVLERAANGRALLRLETPAEQREALAYILSRDLNVAATDAYIERLLEAKTAPESEQQKTFILKDVRVFLNTIAHSLDLMKQGGIDAGIQREETDDSLILTISIPKARQPSQNG